MIEARQLTKRYAGRTAVDAVSFDVEKGEIVGFLGPNGAGKSTTLRMLTCFLSASGGSAKVAGYDIYGDSIEVRRRVGYMPENVPLYPDMRVDEYLRFRARLKGLGWRATRSAVGEAMDICSLDGVEKKIIATLSKGYKQRVGLADALVNKPELLILDEPTNGLDPHQIRQSRELIKRLGERHTILISTHILSEVEMTCGRVIIIDRGQIRASDSPRNLIRRLRKPGSVILERQGGVDPARAQLAAVAGVKEVSVIHQRDGWTSFAIATDPHHDAREDLFALVRRENWNIRELASRAASLEDAFVDLLQQPPAAPGREDAPDTSDEPGTSDTSGT